jgi:hypothetical protein
MTPTATPDRTAKSPRTAAPTTTAAPAAVPAPVVDAPKPEAAKPVAAPKAKTPEQIAAAQRREANECRRAAKTLGEDTDGGRTLLARAVNLETDADAIAPRKTKSTENRPVCSGTKKDGTPCTAHSMEGSVYCTDHRPVRQRFSDAEWEAFGQISREALIDRLGWGVALKMAKEQLGSK